MDEAKTYLDYRREGNKDFRAGLERAVEVAQWMAHKEEMVDETNALAMSRVRKAIEAEIEMMHE